MRPDQDRNRDDDVARALVVAGREIAAELHHIATALSSIQGGVTLAQLNSLEERLTMKLSEVKTQVAQAATRSTEAFAELGTKIADMQRQIDELIAGNTDPEVTDEEFTTNLATLKSNIDSLADIVPAPTVPPAEPTP